MSETKICCRCHLPKSLIDFHKYGRSKDGYKAACKECVKKSEYTNDSRVEAINRAKKRYRNKREEVLAYGKKHKAENADRYRENAKVNSKKRRVENLNVRVKHNLSSELGIALKKQNATKKSRIIQLLGCSIQEFKLWIAAQFKEGMSWENYGKWQLDHVKPTASFDLTNIAGQRLCFHYTNYQPLWRIDNIRKSSWHQNKHHKHVR